jgi:hypothetical protein
VKEVVRVLVSKKKEWLLVQKPKKVNTKYYILFKKAKIVWFSLFLLAPDFQTDIR